ncbi:NUDIX domain-containing protein [Pseudorhizobium endolithicum]|uniref:NUDIX domain-containing protein n=1 Tax=Pseudorhizobium endolithicum TaxID=1191678 RepID=A0ABN7JI92_9HYPH|nr:NUDIX hydrolase [Pseudorhizobium endolithicum]CAD6418216.1 NUDIX domain-containing protein [Rhizobium sp. Q54]CAD7032654.1 NUDIX domain-containing protein [Pseudorhizobium endolithicum]
MSTVVVEPAPFAIDEPPRTNREKLRPRDASTIILLDRRDGIPRFLMGRRGGGHAFMPDVYVFPGGRRDRQDYALPFQRDLHPLVSHRLLSQTTARTRSTTARALALAAMRELQEETGLAPGTPPDLYHLRYVARAVTPPGNVRRFDTRFFLLPTDEANIATDTLRETEELQDPRWVSFSDLDDLNVPRITLAVLREVRAMLDAQPSLPYGLPVPYYFMRRGRFVRTEI